MMNALLLDRDNLRIFGDNAYHDPIESQELLKHNIHIWAVPRKDARKPWPREFKRLARKLRLRIETAFSVITTVFDFQRLGSRSLSGLITRLTSRLLTGLYSLFHYRSPVRYRSTVIKPQIRVCITWSRNIIMSSSRLMPKNSGARLLSEVLKDFCFIRYF